MSANGVRDVVISAPSAVALVPLAPSPEELVQLQAARIRELDAELGQQQIAATTISVYALAMAGYLIQLGHGENDEVQIPTELVRRYDGGHVEITENGPTVSVKIREREG